MVGLGILGDEYNSAVKKGNSGVGKPNLATFTILRLK